MTEKAIIEVSMNGPKCRPKILRFLIRVLKRLLPCEFIWKLGNKCASKGRIKAMKIAATTQGVTSVAIEGDGKNKLVVKGELFDPIHLSKVLRRKVGFARVMSFGPEKKD